MLRVGSVPYLVGRPLDEGLEDEPGIEFRREVPSLLVEMLRDGRLDVALASSVELFRRPGYRYVDGLAVGGEGFVSSVQVFLRQPLERVRRLAVDPASRTSVALTRIVWPGGELEMEEPPPGEDARRVPADGWLRIGDRALREWSAWGGGPVLNPSQVWRERTGLPFAFALWIVRPGVEIGPWLDLFQRARARGAARVEQRAREASAAWDLPLDLVRRYLLEECVYELGDRLAPSVEAFRDGVRAHGLAPAEHAPPVAVGDARGAGLGGSS